MIILGTLVDDCKKIKGKKKGHFPCEKVTLRVYVVGSFEPLLFSA